MDDDDQARVCDRLDRVLEEAKQYADEHVSEGWFMTRPIVSHQLIFVVDIDRACSEQIEATGRAFS